MDGAFQTHSATGTPSVYPPSDYLAERIQQRRAKANRPRRTRHTDIGPQTRLGADDDIFLNEAEEEARDERTRLASSIASMSNSGGAPTRRSTGGPGRRSSMGVRGMEEKMDRLTKDNFALKMEVDQRRRYTTKLQEEVNSMTARLDRFERLQEEHTELWRINDALVKELEKRDRAVEEAIDTICELEDKNGELEDRVGELEEKRSTTSTTRPSTAHADSGYAGTETYEKPSPPKRSKPPTTPQPDGPRRNTLAASAAGDKLQSITNLRTPAPARREPHVLSLKKPSTQALRSVYLDNSQSLNGVKSFISLLKERESVADEAEDEVPNSPRLSVLSETSLSSMYSPRKNQLTPARLAMEEAVNSEYAQSPYDRLQQDSINRVSRWINEGQLPQSPTIARKSSRSSERTERDIISSSPSKRPGDEERFRSIANALASTSGRHPMDEMPMTAPYGDSPKPRKTRPGQRQPRPTSYAGPGYSDALESTSPEVTPRKLRASRSTVVDDRRQSNINSPAPAMPLPPIRTPAEHRLRTAPKQMRSSVELNAAYTTYLQRSIDDSAIVDDDEDDFDSSFTNSNKNSVNSKNGGRGGLQATEKALPSLPDPTRPSMDSAYNDDARSDAVRDLSMDYDGFPDGKSILMGTPSRFLKHGKPPVIFQRTPSSAAGTPTGTPAQNFLFDGSDALPRNLTSTASVESPNLLPRRPQSSAGYYNNQQQSSPGTGVRGAGAGGSRSGAAEGPSVLAASHNGVRKPSLSRADTSPAFVNVGQTVGRLLRRMSGSSKERKRLGDFGLRRG